MKYDRTRKKIKEDLAVLALINNDCIHGFRRIFGHNRPGMAVTEIVDDLTDEEIKALVGLIKGTFKRYKQPT